MKDIFSFVFCLALLLSYNFSALSQETGYSLRFYGNGDDDIDRVKISIDNPPTPADIGATDFTIEFWMKAIASENPADAITCGETYDWIHGNIIIDRDRVTSKAFGISVAGGVVTYGGLRDGNDWPEIWTICGSTYVLDQQWHHVACQRRRSDGWMWLYIDGKLEAEAYGPQGDLSYPDGAVSDIQPNDPFIVIGAEKHDAGPEYPSFSGWVDEVRLSNVLRYNTDFEPSSEPFSTDSNTMALYHFDEGSGDVINDVSGAVGGPSNGVRKFGGSPAGPEWSTDTPFDSLPPDPNYHPVAQNDQNSTNEDTFIEIDVLSNDTDQNNDSLVIVSFSQPKNGTNSVLPNQNIKYSPNADFFGLDSFRYSISDNRGGIDSAKAFITVIEINDSPQIQSNFPHKIEFEADSSFIFDLDTCVFDVDDMVESLVWSVIDTQAVSVNINQSTHICSLYYTKNENLISDTVYFVVRDLGFLYDTTNSVIVRVNYTGMSGIDNVNPQYFHLTQNYPNPFNPRTTISYSVPYQNHVTIEIFNIWGQRVGLLVDEEKMKGVYTTKFDAQDLPSGIYYYRLNSSNINLVKKMLFMK